eukprot:IDg11837t1
MDAPMRQSTGKVTVLHCTGKTVARGRTSRLQMCVYGLHMIIKSRSHLKNGAHFAANGQHQSRRAFPIYDLSVKTEPFQIHVQAVYNPLEIGKSAPQLQHSNTRISYHLHVIQSTRHTDASNAPEIAFNLLHAAAARPHTQPPLFFSRRHEARSDAKLHALRLGADASHATRLANMCILPPAHDGRISSARAATASHAGRRARAGPSAPARTRASRRRCAGAVHRCGAAARRASRRARRRPRAIAPRRARGRGQQARFCGGRATPRRASQTHGAAGTRATRRPPRGPSAHTPRPRRSRKRAPRRHRVPHGHRAARAGAR